MGITDIIQLAIILAVSIGLHEYAHAYASYKLGDPTPKLQGRLTPNPLKHIDPVGFLMIFLVHFGWGKPVQVNPMYYKHPIKGELIVALAGPATNLLLAIMSTLIILIYSAINGGGINGIVMGHMDIMTMFWLQFTFINIALAVFNMIPLRPLDGYRLVKMASGPKRNTIEQQFKRISPFVLIAIIRGGSNIIGEVSMRIFNVIFMILGQIFY